MSTTMMKNNQWFDENAASDLDFIRAHEDISPIPHLRKVPIVDAEGNPVLDSDGKPAFDTVERTYHTPVSSALILEKFRERATALGLRLVNEKGALKRDGRRFMYLADVEDDAHPDYALSIGFRNASDKSLAFNGMCGTHVFVCENGCCSSIVKPSKMRHTIGNVKTAGFLDAKIDTIFSRFLEDKNAIVSQIETMKGTPLTDELLGKFVRRANGFWEEGEFHKNPLIGSCNLCRILEELENPTLNSHEDSSVFRLHNACSYVTTHKFKNPSQGLLASRALNNLIMGLIKPDFAPLGDVVDVEADVVEA